MAPRTKASQKFNNLDLLLQHIRSVIEGRYVLYQECVTAITRAAERRQDASAWFEQLEQLVIGIDTVAFSHAGLVFLLRELMRAPTANEMPPPPLPLRTTSFRKNQLSTTMPPQCYALPSSKAPTPTSPPTSPLTNSSNDPIFFTDPRFKFEVNNLWENPAGSNINFTGSSAIGFNDNSSYNTPNDFIPRYIPADDDMQVYKQHCQRSAERQETVMGPFRDKDGLRDVARQ
ncbi:hypothetical protein SNOG_04852 [Parastagonospora nodorum SN15]|uniref:Uncharacterized protein n=1 Tax=Phaeosphaeria nodorum (strain SN15 / ATCC MYA-4574 / FGSC 10173) TaxID=321614 RepID=Q0UTR2_PHANO|nr:hypothetical protein SNOG_04852 [Parastagonospora nodorum SN15]EAT87243.1 hypothetical protein SNOG_04852 [Parastagonospora nodorum SN15]